MPVWHVSVSVRQNGWTLQRSEWSDELARRAKKLCRKLLREVGRDQEFWKPGQICEHYRKLLTADEIQLLDPKWLALPAIDEAG